VKQKVVVYSRRNLGRLIIFLVLLGILLSYIGSHRQPRDESAGEAVPTPGEELPVFAPREEVDVDYFIDYRLERDSARQQQLDLLREVINNPNSGEEARQEADRRFLHITNILGQEMEIEGLIRAKGFKEALVLLNEFTATAVIKAQTLDQMEVTRIAEIINRTTGLPPTAISVVTYPE